ncbi:hypothetical protein [Pendulispora albinea]|uniref:BZIP transcription factor n=1 Tax=Pendulispora albinea TaxID=2741071 RepID=A0ABZ2LQM6_9BACT
MGPFRSELEASHARIAQLEAEKSDLERQNVELQRRLKLKQKETRAASSTPLHPAWIAVIPTVTTVFITATAVLIGTWRPTCADLNDDVSSFKGISIAPRPAFAPPVHSPLPLLKNPSAPHTEEAWTPYAPSPGRAAVPGRTKSSACDCKPGDPLCSCL